MRWGTWCHSAVLLARSDGCDRAFAPAAQESYRGKAGRLYCTQDGGNAYDGWARRISPHLTDAQSLHLENFVKNMGLEATIATPMGHVASLVDLMNWMNRQQLDVMFHG